MVARCARVPARRAREDEGVSPVVGMVLILAISVLGIVAVTNWGLPAITEMKSNLETRQVLDEFQDLDATLQQLIAGTAGQTTFKWQPTISQGAIDVDGTGNRWMSGADVAPWLKLTWTDVDDLDESFQVNVNATVYNLQFRAWYWVGGAATELRVNSTDSCGAGSTPTSLAPGVTTLWVHLNQSSCADFNLRNAVVTFEVRGSSALVGTAETAHRAFILDVGHVHWSGPGSPRGPTHVFSTNGGVLSGPSGDFVVQNPLGVAPPRNFTNSTGANSTSLFVRFTKFDGNASFSGVGGGAERFAVYLNLVGTYTLGTADNITQGYIYVWGDHRAAAYRALVDPIEGYRFAEETDATTGETYLKHREGSVPFRFTTVYSLVKVES